jgi:hypothetical protein
MQEWGPSVSVNRVLGPTDYGEGLFHIAIKMSSGDVIEVVAKRFDLPAAQGGISN